MFSGQRKHHARRRAKESAINPAAISVIPRGSIRYLIFRFRETMRRQMAVSSSKMNLQEHWKQMERLDF